ncbi:MAG: hypothetical protein KJ787_08975 [Gammaproteobacteria bacterium]|nr:hypothetical protein [Gammaproteobacteria bacterium]MBU1646453.1 hypothetical protein [Gammaproteobacteria bacterium]MBU1970996.1 hypothetical protein [Gammaproteobacteria bacterium]
MNGSGYFRLIAMGVAMLGAGLAVAEESPPVADPAQGSVHREQMQERIRSMTAEEQRLMRETSVDGRARFESRQAAQGESMRGGGRGGGYGQGYESRRGNGGGGGRNGGGGGRGQH